MMPYEEYELRWQFKRVEQALDDYAAPTHDREGTTLTLVDRLDELIARLMRLVEKLEKAAEHENS